MAWVANSHPDSSSTITSITAPSAKASAASAHGPSRLIASPVHISTPSSSHVTVYVPLAPLTVAWRYPLNTHSSREAARQAYEQGGRVEFPGSHWG